MLAISKNRFVKRIVKTSTKHNNMQYAIKQSSQCKPIINTLYLHRLCKKITSNPSLYSDSFSNIFEISSSNKSSAVSSSAVSLLACILACSLLLRILLLTLLLAAT